VVVRYPIGPFGSYTRKETAHVVGEGHTPAVPESPYVDEGHAGLPATGGTTLALQLLSIRRYLGLEHLLGYLLHLCEDGQRDAAGVIDSWPLHDVLNKPFAPLKELPDEVMVHGAPPDEIG
jgi:hypothetical protein